MIEKFRWLGAVIAAHPKGKLYGRIRLQKTIKLLQSRGLPSDYKFKMYYYGPYSEGVQSDTALLELFDFIEEKPEVASSTGKEYYVYTALPDAKMDEIEPFKPMIELLAENEAVILELAATYEELLNQGFSANGALSQIKSMKPDKYNERSMQEAIELLAKLDTFKLA